MFAATSVLRASSSAFLRVPFQGRAKQRTCPGEHGGLQHRKRGWSSGLRLTCLRWRRFPADHGQMLRCVAFALGRDVRGGHSDLAQIVLGQLDMGATDLEPMQLGRPRDRHNVRPLSQQPGERDLGRSRALLLVPSCVPIADEATEQLADLRRFWK